MPQGTGCRWAGFCPGGLRERARGPGDYSCDFVLAVVEAPSKPRSSGGRDALVEALAHGLGSRGVVWLALSVLPVLSVVSDLVDA